MKAALLLLCALWSAEAKWSFGPDSFNCKMRQFAYSFGKQVLPKYGDFESLYYALNLNAECQDESEAQPDFARVGSEPPPPVFPSSGTTYYVDYENGSDDNTGSIEHPFKTIQHAVDAPRGTTATVNLREGTHYLTATVNITEQHSGLTIQNYNGEAVTVSGGKHINPSWSPYKVDAAHNMYVADVSEAGIKEAPGFLVNGVRATRARYPNGNPELPERGHESGNPNGPQYIPEKNATWTPPDPSLWGSPTHKFYTDTNPAHMRNTSDLYIQYTIGTGGPCDVFDPPTAYFCAETTAAGGGGLQFQIPRGVTPARSEVAPPGETAPDAGLHMPYKSMEDAVVNVWRPSRWYNWMFTVDRYDNATNNITFGKGGFQGASGAQWGNDWFVENVFEEFDSPNEYFHDPAGQKLYFYYNGTGSPPSTAEYVVPQLKTLFNLTASRWNPIKDVTIRGLKLTATRYTYLDPHGVPGGGDWALERRAAIFLQGTEMVTVDSCHLTRLDGNGIMVSGYNRNTTISDNEFSWMGANAMAAWGFTNDTGSNPLEGTDGTDGNHPLHTKVVKNLVREIGIWEKQSSAWFQGKAALTTIQDNVFFNGPRAGINFNDGFGGGDVVTGNLVFSMCRESGDHGPINSWDRQPYLTLTATGSPSTLQANRNIYKNFLITNYNVLAGIDTDDGSAYYHGYDNFIVSGTMGLKAHVGSHHIFHYNNVYAYVQRGFWNGDGASRDDLNLYFYNNTLVMTGYEIGHRQLCNQTGGVTVHDNAVYTQNGSATECDGLPAPQTPGTTVHPYPTDDVLIGLGKAKLGV